MNNASTLDSSSSSSSSIVDLFDQLCFSFGDEDAIRVVSATENNNDIDGNDDESTTHDNISSSTYSPSLGYIELQEYSKALASQLHYRYRPQYVLVDCHGWPGAEAVTILACLRLQVPFIPVSCYHQHAGRGRLGKIVEQLLKHEQQKDEHHDTQGMHDGVSIVAVTCCQNDQDPVLGVFQNANVHSILFLDPDGNLQEPLDVPSKIPLDTKQRNDNMYVLFTSGTSSQQPKAVIGSHRSTLERILWFQETLGPFEGVVAKRTPLTFVDAMAEILGTLLTRDSVLVALAPSSLIPQQVVGIGTLVARTECTQISMLPSQLAQLLQYNQSCLMRRPKDDNSDAKSNDKTAVHPSLSCLRRIIVSGEPCSESLWKAFHKTFYHSENQNYTCQLINLYGQTETTGDVCGAVLTEMARDKVVVNGVVSIGKPLRESISIHAPVGLDHKGQNSTSAGHMERSDGETALGIIGHELVVSGHDCFANGYLGQSLDEAQKGGFGFDMTGGNGPGGAPKITSFATGDVGFSKDDLWYVQGRTNDVIKVNGIVTAPSEVESAFLSYRQQSTAFQDEAHTAAAAMVDNRICLLFESKEDEATFCFSRQHMKDHTDLPWNLIPHHVCPIRKMPRTAGTGKVDRSQVKNILQNCIQHLLRRAKDESNNNNNGSTTNAAMDLFARIVGSVLMPEDIDAEEQAYPHLDLSKSFVDIGFDSALSISLLYQLKLHWRPPPKLGDKEEESTENNPLDFLTPTDILNSEQMKDVFDALVEPKNLEKISVRERHRKKPKHDRPSGVFKEAFTPVPITVWDPIHKSVAFAACVDAVPLLTDFHIGNMVGCDVLAGCQNGVVQRVRVGPSSLNGIGVSPATSREFADICVTLCHHLIGWRVSSDMLLACDDSIIVCAVRHPVQDASAVPGAKIMGMSMDLATVKWTNSFPISCTAKLPIFCENDIWLLEVNDSEGAHAIGILQGQEDGHYHKSDHCIPLPVSVTAMPVLLSDCRCQRLDGTLASKVMVYASSDFETGLILIDVERKMPLHHSTTTTTDSEGTDNNNESQRFFSDSIGPTHKGLVAWDAHSVLVVDAWGSLHSVNLQSMECKSIKVANKPLSCPAVTQGPIRDIVVGSYDGTVHCIDGTLTTCLWTLDVKSVVYAKPLALWDESSVVVCTTAGDILQIDLASGKLLWQYRMPVGAEVWSTPVELPSHNNLSTSFIAVGARDSRLHFVQVGKWGGIA